MGDLRQQGTPAARPEWTLRTPDGEPVTTFDQLLALLLIDRAPLTERRQVLTKFLALPVAEAMPPALREAVEAGIDG
jgi:hypothetical protein